MVPRFRNDELETRSGQAINRLGVIAQLFSVRREFNHAELDQQIVHTLREIRINTDKIEPLRDVEYGLGVKILSRHIKRGSTVATFVGAVVSIVLSVKSRAFGLSASLIPFASSLSLDYYGNVVIRKAVRKLGLKKQVRAAG